MYIGVVAPEFPPDIGGIETYSYEFVRELTKRGYKVTVFVPPAKDIGINLPGVRVIRELTLRKHKDCRLFDKYHFDVWHVMNAAYSWLALEKGVVVVSIHGNDFLRPYINLCSPDLQKIKIFWRFNRLRSGLKLFDKFFGRWLTGLLLRRSLPHASHILANSKYTEDVFHEKFPSCRKLTSVGLVGVAENFFNVQRKSRDKNTPPQLMTLCRLSEKRKNVDNVLKALATLTHRYNFRYTVVGDGYLRPELETLTQELGLTEKVRFCGFLNKKKLEQQFASSDLFILTSSILPNSHEGFGIAYLEANACGMPVLAARLAGAVEAVEEGVSGMFVDEPSVEAIASRLEDFFSGRINFDSEACRRFARQFSWVKVIEHAETAYLKAIKNDAK